MSGKIFLHTLSETNSVILMNARWQRRRSVKEYFSYYSSLTNPWIPSFPEAILSEIATITAGKPAVHYKKSKTKKVKGSISLALESNDQ